jgi:hypothetical protein
MNKGDGDKQRRQKDTIIPNSNPVKEHRGRAQSMTLEGGIKKGMKQVLEYHGATHGEQQHLCISSHRGKTLRIIHAAIVIQTPPPTLT